MAVAFSRTTCALRADRGLGSWLTITGGAALLVAWTLWFVLGRVTVYQVSQAAHVEVASSSRNVAALHGGRLVASGLYIGRRVHAGEILAELDAETQKLQLAEAEARLAAFPVRLRSLGQQLASARAAEAGAGQARAAALAVARARTREAQASADFDRSLARKQRLDADSGGAARIDAERADAAARSAVARQQASAHDEGRIVGEAATRRADLSSETARLAAAIPATEGEQAAAEAQVAQLRLALDARKIRAPADGVIGNVMPVKLGEVLGDGAALATIVPEGDLHIIAAFDPAKGLGRLAEGQTARLRLDGFAWTQYGDFPASVERVAAESSGNALRVELRMKRRAHEDLPLRHGMTGQVDVAIERVSPAVLVLRAIGQLVA